VEAIVRRDVDQERQSTTASRATRQRAAIAAALQDQEAFLTAQELHALLTSGSAKVGLTTIYRNLQSMAERGEVDVVRRADGESMYRRCDRDEHHHHLVCSGCGYSVEIDNPDLERWASSTAARHGFTLETHDLELFGLCEACSPGPRGS
jgi:Fur family transcriptional regulator, ferric uptake regulator